MQPPLLCSLFSYPPPPLSADVINRWPLAVFTLLSGATSATSFLFQVNLAGHFTGRKALGGISEAPRGPNESQRDGDVTSGVERRGLEFQ